MPAARTRADVGVVGHSAENNENITRQLPDAYALGRSANGNFTSTMSGAPILT